MGAHHGKGKKGCSVTMIVKLSELCSWLGIGSRQVNKLAKAGIIPKAKRGQYELKGCVRAYIEYLKDGDPDKKTSLHDEQLRLVRAQAKKIELDIEQKEGRLIPDTEIVKVMERLIVATRNSFILLRNEVPRIRASESNTDGKEIIDKRINAILTELAKAQVALPGDGEDDPEHDAALESPAKPLDKRVGRRKNVAES